MAEVIKLRRNRERTSFAEFMSGSDFKDAIASITTWETVEAFARADTLSPTATKVLVSTHDSAYPIYAWRSGNTLFWHSDAKIAYLNADSESMFERLGEESEELSISLSGISAAQAVTMNKLFYFCPIVVSPIPRNWNMLNVTTIEQMFYSCKKLRTVDLAALRTSSTLANANSLFMECSSLTSVNISCDFTGVQNFRNLFRGCTALTAFDFSGSDLSSLPYGFPSAFEGCTALYTVDLQASGLSGVRTYGESMFRNCTHLRSVRFPSFTADETMAFGASLFQGCTELVEVDLSLCSSGQNAELRPSARMFSGCSALRTVYVSENPGVLSSPASEVFKNCVSLVGGAGTTFDSSHINSEYARIDNRPTAPGYLTYKAKTI